MEGDPRGKDRESAVAEDVPRGYWIRAGVLLITLTSRFHLFFSRSWGIAPCPGISDLPREKKNFLTLDRRLFRKGDYPVCGAIVL